MSMNILQVSRILGLDGMMIKNRNIIEKFRDYYKLFLEEVEKRRKNFWRESENNF